VDKICEALGGAELQGNPLKNNPTPEKKNVFEQRQQQDAMLGDDGQDDPYSVLSPCPGAADNLWT